MSTQTQTAPPLVRYDVVDGVANIVINRPEAFNCYDWDTTELLRAYFRRAIADDRVQGLVLGGEGKAFIVGADLDFFVNSIEARELWRIVSAVEYVHDILLTVDHSPKPIVARVGGLALGGGFEFALACDYVVASPAATFGFPETSVGVFPCSGGTQRTSRLIGVGLAKWLILTGKVLSARQALNMGLIHQIVPADQLDATCRAIALGGKCPPRNLQRTSQLAALERFFDQNRVDELYAGTADTHGDAALARAMKSVASKAPIALRVAERLIEAGSRMSVDEGSKMETAHVMQIFETEDARRGLKFRLNGGLGQPAFAGR